MKPRKIDAGLEVTGGSYCRTRERTVGESGIRRRCAGGYETSCSPITSTYGQLPIGAGDEFGMFLAADGKTLYFASDGLEGGYGSSDVWKATRLDDSWTNWSKPVNMGPKINSDDWEAYFTIPASGEYAYFVSEKNSLGEEDIYRIALPKEAKPEPVVLVTGVVKNKKTGN